MPLRRDITSGTYVTKRVAKGSSVVGTIATPAGNFQTISKDVFDRAVRSANAVLKHGVGPSGDARTR